MADGPATDTSTAGETGEPSGTDGGGKRRKSMAERLESGERILSLIEKAEAKRVAKKKIIHFLKRKGVTEAKIIEAYQEFYVKERLYEITFTERPLGFSVIMDTRGNNAIVSSIQSQQNEDLGLKVASRMYEVNGKRVDGLKHKQILSVIASCDCPFFIVFKESKRTKKTKAKKLKKLMDEINNRDGPDATGKGVATGEGDAAVWQSDEESSESETDSSDESDYEDSEDSEESSGYSSSDDEAHIEAHLERKLAHEKKKQERMARKKRKHRGADPGVFRPNEINEWDEEVIDSEQTEMMKELAKLMIVGAMTSDVAPQSSSGGELSGMSSKRAKTFEKMVVAATPKGSMDESSVAEPLESEVSSGSRPGDGHRKSRSMSFSVTDLMAFEEEEAGYDQEIFGILSSLTGDDLADAMNKSHSFRSSMAVPSVGYGHVTTPSMSAALGAMWSQVELYGDETSDDPTMSLPPGAFPGSVSPVPYDLSPAPGDASSAAASGSGSYPDTMKDGTVAASAAAAAAPSTVESGETGEPDSSSALPAGSTDAGDAAAADGAPSEDDEKKEAGIPEDEKDGGDTSVLDTMKGGTTFMKYGRFGRPKYRMFQLTKDHKHLVWFSPRKDQSDTKIPIKYIQEIKIGKESDAATRAKKNEDVQETSFTVVYGRTKKSKQSLTVTAKNEKEAVVWAQGLKILADYARQGRDISKIKSIKTDTPESSASAAGADPRRRQQSVIIDMDRMRSSSVKALFSSKTDTVTVAALRKKHSQLKAQLQKCVDFVMTKSNYRVIKEKGEFDGVKAILEGIDVRLRDTKEMLSGSAETTDISGAKSELFSVHADLDALRHKLTVLVRQQKKL